MKKINIRIYPDSSSGKNIATTNRSTKERQRYRAQVPFHTTISRTHRVRIVKINDMGVDRDVSRGIGHDRAPIPGTFWLIDWSNYKYHVWNLSTHLPSSDQRSSAPFRSFCGTQFSKPFIKGLCPSGVINDICWQAIHDFFLPHLWNANIHVHCIFLPPHRTSLMPAQLFRTSSWGRGTRPFLRFSRLGPP